MSKWPRQVMINQVGQVLARSRRSGPASILLGPSPIQGVPLPEEKTVRRSVFGINENLIQHKHIIEFRVIHIHVDEPH